ncbi:glyoxalase family protein [Chishuiella changwenlii]|uniref:Diguanylate cyclase n=1 Tax=Chishuiella changwenlii TaxID=1434701 RepID=A0A1M6Z7G6_9FLAO|nr:ring-cleaving dioxygenase [Chishuiella changwenlii]GGE86941.1 diguanylate cyclase [Chishuiella changwenlii]SHL26407.1 glyoxalase family protein [Chishuiella changwenlii]
MENRILGLHHITAIAGNANRNLAFYTQVLGLRLVKKTVNFDDPTTYHFYFGNEEGTPGTILTFFPWERISKGTNGSGLATHIGYSVPKGSLEFWKNRLQEFHVDFEEGEIFGEKLISFQDPDGLQLQFIESSTADDRKPWVTDDIKDENGLKGFHNITLTLKNAAPTIKVLTDIFGYDLQKKEGDRYRFATNAIETANIVDIIENDEIQSGKNAAGTNHHVAFRVKDEEVLMEFREKVVAAGLNITTKIDRDYFYSLYFREPGGILFEIATDNPGFTVDEPLDELGTNLKLPKQHEPLRSRIEEVLPKLS